MPTRAATRRRGRSRRDRSARRGGSIGVTAPRRRVEVEGETVRSVFHAPWLVALPQAKAEALETELFDALTRAVQHGTPAAAGYAVGGPRSAQWMAMRPLPVGPTTRIYFVAIGETRVEDEARDARTPNEARERRAATFTVDMSTAAFSNPEVTVRWTARCALSFSDGTVSCSSELTNEAPTAAEEELYVTEARPLFDAMLAAVSRVLRSHAQAVRAEQVTALAHNPRGKPPSRGTLTPELAHHISKFSVGPSGPLTKAAQHARSAAAAATAAAANAAAANAAANGRNATAKRLRQ
jgi:hypothetical protein